MGGRVVHRLLLYYCLILCGAKLGVVLETTHPGPSSALLDRYFLNIPSLVLGGLVNTEKIHRELKWDMDLPPEI